MVLSPEFLPENFPINIISSFQTLLALISYNENVAEMGHLKSIQTNAGSRFGEFWKDLEQHLKNQ